MRTGISFSVTSADLDRLGAVINDRNAPQKHVWRAQIVLLSAEGLGTNAIMRETGKSKTCVWRWQERFAAEGVIGLLRQDAALPHPEARFRHRGARRRADHGGASARSDALDRRGDGRGGGRQRQFRAAHLARARA
jgi:Winged helix-turn helix